MKYSIHRFLLCALTLCNSGCSKQEKEQIKTQESLQNTVKKTQISLKNTESSKTAIEAADKDAVILNINNKNITKKDFERHLFERASRTQTLNINKIRSNEEFIKYRKNLIKQTRKYLEKSTLQEIIHQQALFLLAEKIGLKIDEADLQHAFEEELKKRLKASKNTENSKKIKQSFLSNIKRKQAREYKRNNLLLQKLRLEALKDIKEISDQELEKLYLSKKDMFQDEIFVELYQLTFSKNSKSKNIYTDINKIRKSLLTLKKSLLNRNFSEIAAQKSQDSYRSKAGRVGYISTRKLLPALAAAAEQVELNTVSEIIESEKGLHLILVLKREVKKIHKQEIKQRLAKLWKRDRQDQALKKQIEEALKLITVKVLIEPVSPPIDLKQQNRLQQRNSSNLKNPPLMNLPSGDSHQLPLPSKDNVLPGMRNPHDKNKQPLKLNAEKNKENALKL